MKPLRIKAVALITVILVAISVEPGSAWVDNAHNVAVLESSSGITPQSSDTSSDGSYYTTGYFTGTQDFVPGDGNESLVSNGSEDLYVAKYSSTGGLIWCKSVGGSGAERGISIALDANNNIYLAGYTNGDVDFDPGIGFDTKTALNLDGFLLKLNSNGEYQWVKKFDGTYSVNATAVEVDNQNNVIVGGSFFGTLPTDPGNGVPNLSASTSYTDNWIAKVNPSGGYIWAKSFTGSAGSDGLIEIAVGSSDEVVATGNYQGAIDFDPSSSSSSNTTSNGSNEVFAVKLDSSGLFQWVRTIGGAAADHGTSVEIDASGNVIVAGDFKGTVDFNPGVGVQNQTSQGDYDAFILKLDSGGTYLWSKQIGGLSTEYNVSSDITPQGTVFISGYFSQTVDFDALGIHDTRTSTGSTDVFVTKFESNGNYGWTKSFGNSANADSSRTTNVVPDGKVWVTGTFRGSVDFDTSSEVFELTSSTGGIFMIQLDSGGLSTNIISVSDSEVQRKLREERERQIQKARYELMSSLLSGNSLTLDQFTQANLKGVTSKNVDLINREILEIPADKRSEFIEISNIVYKYELAGRVESKMTFYYSELVVAGLANQASPNKTAVVRELSKMETSKLDSIAEIVSAIQSIEAKYLARKNRLIEIISKIAQKFSK